MFGLNVHAALAGVPPVLLFVIVQLFVAPLKLSVNILADKAEFEFELAVKLNEELEEQTESNVELIERFVGTGLIVTVALPCVPQHPSLVTALK